MPGQRAGLIRGQTELQGLCSRCREGGWVRADQASPSLQPNQREAENVHSSFTSHQKAELEALFSLTQFPDYVTQESLASKINLQYTVVQV